MATKSRRHKRRRSGEWRFEDFKAVLVLPERLAAYLRQLLQLSLEEWSFCLAKLREYHDWQDRVRSAQASPGTESGQRAPLPPAPDNPAYREWSISKGPGRGHRHFAAPCDELKLVQRRILDRFLSQILVHPARHGNQRGSSILSNARVHAGFAVTVFNLDLVNAFPSVARARVRANLRKPFRYALRAFRGIRFGDDDLTQLLEALVDLLVLHDRLPQGPPSSPRVLDLVCLNLDGALYELLISSSTPFQEYRYTAWLDDLTISTNGPSVPSNRQKRGGF